MAETVRAGKLRTYRWYPADRELIDRLRQHFAGPTGQPCLEVDVLRAALCSLADREGLVDKKTREK